MFKPVHYALAAGFLGLAAAALTVDSVGPRAESALKFMLKQQRHRSAPSYPVEAVPVRRHSFFEDLFDFEFRERPQQPRAAAPQLQRVVCKRQCDGVQLVMGFLPKGSRQKEAEAMCAAAGGGAPTQLVLEKFVPGAGFAPVQTASTAPLIEGRAALDTAAPQPQSRPASDCPQGLAHEPFMTVPILHDATLRKGDVVATRGGFKVFVGGGKPPFKEKDFVALDLRKKSAADLRKLQVADN